MERLGQILIVPLGIIWSFAGPVTFILSILDTWQTKMSVVWKLLFNFTLDALAATLWPITWLIWGVRMYLGYHTPLGLIF